MLRPLAAAVLLLLAAAPLPAVPEGPPRVLVLGFTTRGAAFDRDQEIDEALEIVAEEWLGRWFDPVSGAELSRAPSLFSVDWPRDPEARVRLAREVGADRCVCGFVAAFGERFILVLEAIDAEAGLPGIVVREECRGIEALPDALERALARAFEAPDTPPPAPPSAAKPPPAPAPADRGLRWLAGQLLEEEELVLTPDPATKELRWLLQTPGPDSAGETERLGALFRQVAEHLGRLRADPDYRAEWEWRTRISLDPVLREFRLEIVRRGRFLVLVDATAPRAADLAEMAAGMLAGFRQDLLALLGLPDDPPPGRLHRVLVFEKEEGFRRYQEAVGASVPGGTACLYVAASQWLCARVDAPLAMEGRDEPALRDLRHGAVHQVLHALAKAHADRTRGGEVPWTDRALLSGPFWLQEGFAELAAATLPAREPTAALATPDRLHLAQWRAAEKEGRPGFTLPELLAERDTGSMLRTATRKGLADRQRVASLFYAGAALFCDWLANGREGALRPLLLDAVRAGIRGAFDEAAFRQGFGTDLADLEAEWRAWIGASR